VLFPRAVLADEGDHLAARDRQGDRAERRTLGAGIRERGALERDAAQVERGRRGRRVGAHARPEVAERLVVVHEERTLVELADQVGQLGQQQAGLQDGRRAGGRLRHGHAAQRHQVGEQADRDSDRDRAAQAARDRAHEPTTSQRPQVGQTLVEQLPVLLPQVSAHAERADLLRVRALGQQLRDVRPPPAVDAEADREVVELAAGRGHAQPERDQADEQHRQEQRLQDDQRHRDPDERHARAQEAEQRAGHLERTVVGLRVRTLQSIVELRMVEGVELDASGHVEHALGRLPRDQLGSTAGWLSSRSWPRRRSIPVTAARRRLMGGPGAAPLA